MSSKSYPQLRVVFVTTGYPTSNQPSRGISRHRSIEVLSRHIDAFVIHIRAWKPRRALVKHRQWESIPILSLALPQIPFPWAMDLNVRILAQFGSKLASQHLSNADVIDSIGVYPTGYICSQWSRCLGKTHVTEVTGSDVNLHLKRRLASGGLDWLETLDGVGCMSVTTRDTFTTLVPGLANVKVTYRGVDLGYFSPNGPSMGLQSMLPPVRFLYLGGFQTWDPRLFDPYNMKGGHVLLEAWQSVESEVGPSSVLIGGPGTDLSRLEEWRSSLLRPEQVHFLQEVAPDMVPGLIRASDVVVLPSLYEGLPNLTLEAQACGRPVLGTDAGGIPESVAHGKTGLIVPRGDPQALARGFLWFLEHQSEIQRMGVVARQRMSQQFSWERYSTEMISLFQAAIAHRNSVMGAALKQV